MSTSNPQIVANRENAQRSTGPRTPDGKQRASLNATSHGLTGKAVLLPDEDKQAYETLCREFAADLKPKGAMETHLVQTLADQQWRLHRAHARENGVDNPNQLEQLTRHASRILRDYNTTLKALQSVQNERKSLEATELHQAGFVQKLMDMKKIDWDPADDGFVLSREQIRAGISRRTHCDESHRAQYFGWDLKKFTSHAAA